MQVQLKFHVSIKILKIPLLTKSTVHLEYYVLCDVPVINLPNDPANLIPELMLNTLFINKNKSFYLISNSWPFSFSATFGRGVLFYTHRAVGCGTPL